MTFFPDLTPYSYKRSGIRDHTVNVGWLEAGQPYPKGEVSPEFIESIWRYCCAPVVRTRGFHECDLCATRQKGQLQATREGNTLKLGTAEIRVFGPDGTIYAAPDLIYHYILDHKYHPPEAFIEAVLSSPLPGTDEYARQLSQLELT